MRLSPPPTRDRRTGVAGFTLVEVMVAMLVLLVGILGTLKLFDGALTGTAGNNARVGATNLGRELAETARGLDYDNLTAALLAETLQARGLGTPTPWKIARRGVTYTIAESVCTYDDAADKIAASPPNNVCSPLPPGATGDDNGDDFRRVSFDVSWSDQGRSRTLTQTALVVNPSGGLGPRITSVSPLAQTITANVATATINYQTTAAAALHWQADNGKTEADATGGPTNWAVNWSIGSAGSGSEVLDGTYRITAQAFAAAPGDSRTATVILNRRRPDAPPSLAGGHDTRVSDWVDLEWALNDERDIVGYRVFWSGPDAVAGNADDVQVCPTDTAALLPETAVSCTDLSPRASGATQYYVVAYDRDGAGAVAAGTRRTVSIAAPAPRPAAAAGPLTVATNADGDPTLSWQPSPTGGVSFYRIYRDGTAIGDRQDRTGDSSTTWTDGAGGSAPHDYWVTAVDSRYNESNPLGPVSWTP